MAFTKLLWLFIIESIVTIQSFLLKSKNKYGFLEKFTSLAPQFLPCPPVDGAIKS